MVYHGSDAKSKAIHNMHGGLGEALVSPAVGDFKLPEKMSMFIKLTLPPGATIGYHEHHGETEFFVFTSGSGRVMDDDKYIDIKAGDVTATPSGHGHNVENTGDTDLVYYAFIVKD